MVRNGLAVKLNMRENQKGEGGGRKDRDEISDIAFISSLETRWCNTATARARTHALAGSGDIYVTVKGVKRSGKVSSAAIGRRLP